MQAWLHLSWLVMERAGVTERVVKMPDAIRKFHTGTRALKKRVLYPFVFGLNDVNLKTLSPDKEHSRRFICKFSVTDPPNSN